MSKTAILSLAALAMLGSVLGSVLAEAAPGDRLRARLEQRQGASAAPALPGGQTIAYGRDPLQVLDFWRAKGAVGPAPLVIYVHGGGWKRGSKDSATGQWKAPHYTAAGYGFASINYRLVPQATVEQQAADVAASLKSLLDRAGELGIDRTRVVLMGHSAGAHLVALVGTDPRYLRGVGLSLTDIDGVIAIDGAAYDVPAQMRLAGPMMKKTYVQAFGTEPERQRALSPTFQAAAPNAAAFLVPHVQRKDGAAQSNELAATLSRAGTPAETASFPGEGLQGHAEINRRMGDPDYAATPVVDAWLKRVFGR